MLLILNVDHTCPPSRTDEVVVTDEKSPEVNPSARAQEMPMLTYRESFEYSTDHQVHPNCAIGGKAANGKEFEFVLVMRNAHFVVNNMKRSGSVTPRRECSCAFAFEIMM